MEGKKDEEDKNKPKQKKLQDDFEVKFTKKARGPEIVNEDEDNNSEASAPLDLSCLFSPNWLNDEVIDNYLELLQNFDSDVFMFKTYFYQKFAVESFEGVKNYYRRYDFLSKKLILIPVHYGPHWFLISYGGENLSLMILTTTQIKRMVIELSYWKQIDTLNLEY